MRKTLEFAAVTARAKLLVDSSTGLKWLGAPPDPDDLRPTTADVGALLASDVEEVLAGTHLVVLGVRLADGTPVETVARRLHDAHPHVGIFVVAARTECAPTRVVVLANAGVDEAYLLTGLGSANGSRLMCVGV